VKKCNNPEEGENRRGEQKNNANLKETEKEK